MTKQRKLKKKIRARKAAKQETYTQSRRKTLKPREPAKCEHPGCGAPATNSCHASCCNGETALCDAHEHRDQYAKDALGIPPLGLAVCTKCGCAYTLHETKSRRCEFCDHTPVEVIPAEPCLAGCNWEDGATERACVLPKGHRSDERGDDHRSPDGVWWNEGWVKETAERIDRMAVDALLRAGSEGPTTPITGGQPLTREALEKAVADYKVRHQYESADPADVGALWDTPDVPVRGFAQPVPKEAAEAIGNLRRAASVAQAAEGEQVLKEVTGREGPFPCPRCGTFMVDGGHVGFYCPKKDCLPELPKAEHTLTVDVGDMPPEVAASFIERLKVQWKRMAREVVAPLGREEFERQAEKMAFVAVEEAVRAADKKLSEAAFIAELTALAKSHAPPPRVEGPTPSELTQWNSLSEEEKKALDEAMKNQPPCTCEVDSRTCRFHRAPVVSPSEVPVTQWKPDSESSIQSRAGVLGEEFWLVRGGKDVYRLGYKDRSGRTILGDEGNCTCPNRDGASFDCEFHHPKQTVDVAQRVKERLLGGPVRVTVNGKLVEVDGPTMDYRAVVSAAGYSPERVLSVTYRLREGGDRERSGSLWPTKAPVEVANGMVFSVADTSNA